MRANQQVQVIHGYRRAFLMAGKGPALLLIHGIGDSSRTWDAVLPLLAKHHTVIAPDLLGHGDSDKPRADYSLGGFANGMRDLLLLLGIPTATVVGHSLGGGIALQFAYQYPQMCERLILVASGGFGAEVTPLLRAAALPGAGLAIAAAVRTPVRLPLLTAARVAGHLGLLDRHDVRGAGLMWDGLQDASTRNAFLRTLRSVIDIRGQAVGQSRPALSRELHPDAARVGVARPGGARRPRLGRRAGATRLSSRGGAGGRPPAAPL